MEAQPPKILIVDSDPALLPALGKAVSARGYDVLLAASAKEALQAAVDFLPDLVLIELTLSDGSGLDVCKDLRGWLQVPILLLSHEQRPAAVVAALDIGADDFIKKPFHATELLARIRSHLRRSLRLGAVEPIFEIRGLRVDVPRRKVFKQGREIRLTKTEFTILQHLIANLGRVVTYNLLLSCVWGYGYETNTQTLRVHIKNLRQKIESHNDEAPLILTEPGVGYRFNAVEP
jgi:two-component system, OmpR family, KDP operon response regulator KdpE